MPNLNVRMPADLHKAIQQTAQHNRRSINSEILTALEFYLKNAPAAHYVPSKPKKGQK